MASRHSERPPKQSRSLPGDALEASAYRYFKAEIDAGRFFVRPDAYAIFRKRAYYSRDRKDHIIFDLAIEAYAPGTRDLALLVLVECKDSVRPVPVDDVEEFHSKLSQVAGSKGILLATAGFQRATLTFAESHRIALARYFALDQVKWELRRALISQTSGDCLYSSREEVLRGLLGEATSNVCARMYGCYGSTVTNVPSILMRTICEDAIADKTSLRQLRVNSRPQTQVKFLTPDEIRARANSMLRSIRHSSGGVDLDAICAECAKTVGLTYRNGVTASPVEIAARVLGRVRFDPLEIVIYGASYTEAEMRRFTLGHELGHVALKHGRYIEAEYFDVGDIEREVTSLGDNDLSRIEWQANRFASELLMPLEEFVAAFRLLARHLDLRKRGFGELFVDSQQCNQRAFFTVTSELSRRYKVSPSAAAVRLKTLGLLKVGSVDGMSRGLRAMLGPLKH